MPLSASCACGRPWITVARDGDRENGSAPTTLRKGETATYAPGEVTRVRCRREAADARPITVRVPAPGERRSVIADGEVGYSSALTVATHADGTVVAECD